ncbi:MAG: lipopolysaccharide biosynthesis protein [Bacilli bacterium]
MENNVKIEQKTSKSIKWSFFGELIVKLISPITNMILARLLAPEVFGVIATISIVIALSELLADSGFSKAIVQQDYETEEDYSKSTTTAFWTTLGISLLIFVVVAIFRNPISSLVGSPGYGFALLIASIQMPIYSLSSIHLSILRRKFLFKKIFWVRFASAVVPLAFGTILALLGFSYWSLIISSLASITIQSLLIIFLSRWRPTFSFSYPHLKNMFLYSFLNLLEALLVWVTASIDIVIISYFFGDSLTGMYRLSSTTVQALVRLVTAVFVPVLFSSLSRLKNDELAFKQMFSKFQRMIAYILFPIGAGVFLYRELATSLFFGEGWEQVALVVGLNGFVLSFIVPINNLASVVYFAKGKPLFSIFSQIIYLALLLIVCFVVPNYGFESFIIFRGLSPLILVISSVIFLKIFFGIGIKEEIGNILPALLITSIMFVAGLLLKNVFAGIWWDAVVIVLCMAIYFSLCFVIFRKDIKILLQFLFKKEGKAESGL